MKAIGRDVPLPPQRGAFSKARTEQLRPDADPIGPRERWCHEWSRRLRPLFLVLGPTAALGACLTAFAVFVAGGAAGFVWWQQHHTFAGMPPIDPSRPGIWIGLVVTAVSSALIPTTRQLSSWLATLVLRGGWDDHRALLDLEQDLGEDAAPTVLWDALVRQQAAGAGARPETVIRWVRSVRQAPPEEWRGHLLALREHLKDGEALAQDTIATDPRGGIALVTFGGAPYESAELTTLTRRAADGIRDLLALLPPT